MQIKNKRSRHWIEKNGQQTLAFYWVVVIIIRDAVVIADDHNKANKNYYVWRCVVTLWQTDSSTYTPNWWRRLKKANKNVYKSPERNLLFFLGISLVRFFIHAFILSVRFWNKKSNNNIIAIKLFAQANASRTTGLTTNVLVHASAFNVHVEKKLSPKHILLVIFSWTQKIRCRGSQCHRTASEYTEGNGRIPLQLRFISLNVELS